MCPESHHPQASDEPANVTPVRPGLLKMGCAALAEVLDFKNPADATLRDFFKVHPQLGRRDRGFISETVFAVLRRLRYFTYISDSSSVRRIFIAAADTLTAPARRELGPALSSDEAAWLGQIPRRASEPPPFGVAADLPDWLIERMLAAMTREQVLEIGQAMQQPAPLDLRVNTLRATRVEVLAMLRRSGYEVNSTPYSPLCLRLQGKPTLEQHPTYLSGKIEVQDEGSQLLGLLLAPRRREMVVDFCAGTGGKTLLLGQLMRSEGPLYAFDVSASRLLRLRKRLARSGLSNVHPEVIAHENDKRLERLAGKVDRVLVDAPCTGTGTLRRRPDLKWRQNDAAVDQLRVKQAAILAAAARLVKSGGRLVYATCSILPQENDEIVENFLDEHPEFAERPCRGILHQSGVEIDCGDRLHLLPQVHGTDGFFAAVLQRRSETD